MERALRATEDRGINVGVPFCPWSQGGAPFFVPERTFRARHREGEFGGATAPGDFLIFPPSGGYKIDAARSKMTGHHHLMSFQYSEYSHG